MFQDLVGGRLDVRKARDQAVISEQSSRKNMHLSCIGKDGMGFNQSNNRGLLPTHIPSLIREEESLVSLFTLHSSLKQKTAFTLAEGATHVALLDNQRKIAFTLAEVLITLGIIGVVAAMTMPSLIQNYRDKELIVRTKKAYAVIQNAVLLAKSQNDVTDGDNTFLFDTSKTSAQVAQEFSKYFNAPKLCLNSSSKDCKDLYYDIQFATKEGGMSFRSDTPKIILNDGTVLSIAQMSSCYRVNNDCVQDINGNCVTDADGNTTPRPSIHTDCAYIYFDVNGAKLPNQFGRDNYLLKVYTNSIKGSSWAPEGAASLKNILTGKDKLEYTKF